MSRVVVQAQTQEVDAVMTDSQIAPPAPRQRRPLPRFRLRAMFVWVTLLALLAALGTWAHRGAERNSANLGFHWCLLAVLNSEDSHQFLPHTVAFSNGSDHAPLSSWRWQIAPYHEDFALAYRYDQAWNAAANSQWVGYENDLFCHTGGSGASRFSTNIFAITGPDTAFGDHEVEPPHALADVPGDAILIVEVRDSGVHWMEPGDFDIRTMLRTLNAADGKGISSRFREGFHVGFADGEVWFLGNDVGFDRLSQFFTLAGAKEHDREKELGPFRLDQPPRR